MSESFNKNQSRGFGLFRALLQDERPRGVKWAEPPSSQRNVAEEIRNRLSVVGSPDRLGQDHRDVDDLQEATKLTFKAGHKNSNILSFHLAVSKISRELLHRFEWNSMEVVVR